MPRTRTIQGEKDIQNVTIISVRIDGKCRQFSVSVTAVTQHFSDRTMRRT
jgi:hypothetical protein